MFDKSTDHENDVMMAQFVCLFLVCAIFRETSTEMDVQTVNVIVFFFFFFTITWSILLSTIEMTSKLCNETTRLGLVVPFEF